MLISRLNRSTRVCQEREGEGKGRPRQNRDKENHVRRVKEEKPYDPRALPGPPEGCCLSQGAQDVYLQRIFEGIALVLPLGLWVSVLFSPCCKQFFEQLFLVSKR